MNRKFGLLLAIIVLLIIWAKIDIIAIVEKQLGIQRDANLLTDIVFSTLAKFFNMVGQLWDFLLSENGLILIAIILVYRLLRSWLGKK
ncbi:hypothetical protein [Tuberibacillus sp. Marseille-P3662]|uniref:hypothetical protein n=1 Tax=Tuberibacillus sp. Marseille-P3662 TaxID=1965358 RepID=UPI000A1CCCEA|nr:hypothetical protein [Tuberibacillus sp. Marseille-P3662]